MPEWSHYVQYRCRHRDCQAECINHLDASCTHYKECRECHQSRDAELRARTDHLRERWPSAESAAYVGQTPEEKRRREQIEKYLDAHPNAKPVEILDALGLPPDARRLIKEVDADIDPTEPVSFDRPPEWHVKSVTVGEEEHPASAGTGVELVETVDPLDHLLNKAMLGCVQSDSILWRCERTGVTMWRGKRMAQYLLKHGIRHPEVVDDLVTPVRVPNPDGHGSVPRHELDNLR